MKWRRGFCIRIDDFYSDVINEFLDCIHLMNQLYSLILCCHYFGSKFHEIDVCINFYIASRSLYLIKLRDKKMYFPMQMNFDSFENSYQKEAVVFQSQWLVIFDPRLPSCWSWWQQVCLQKGTVKIWDIDVSSWSTSFSDKCGKNCGMKSSETARKSCFDD